MCAHVSNCHSLKLYLQHFILTLILFSVANRFNTIAHGKSLETYLFMTPLQYTAKEVGEVFYVTVEVSSFENLSSLHFTVTYNTSLLNVEKVVQGPLACCLFPPPPRSSFEFRKNESLGYVEVNMSLVCSETPKSGNGSLAWISFQVVQGPNSCVSSPLELQETTVLDSELNAISHSSVGAVYFWKSIQPDPPSEGRFLDLFTQKNGTGPNKAGGEFKALETVYLISRVTYDNDPVQQKLVSYEVRNPSNETVVFRTAITDQSGLAVISFRIPGILSSNGTWTAISVVEIAGKAVWDTISFQVDIVIPIGGCTYPIKLYAAVKPLTFHLVILVVLTAAMELIKRKCVKD